MRQSGHEPVRRTDLHRRADDAFRSLGEGIAAHPWRVVVISLVVVVVLGYGNRYFETDFSNDSYLLPGDDSIQRYDAFRDRFGQDARLVVALEPPDVFDLEFLSTLRELHHAIENDLPYVEEVTSLVNARHTRGENDQLIVEDLMVDWPETAEDLAALRATVLANPIYENVLVSDDGRFTQIVIRPATYGGGYSAEAALAGFEETGGEAPEYLDQAEGDELVGRLIELTDRYRTDALPIHLVGENVIGYWAGHLSRQDMTLFTGVSLLIMAVMLPLMCRRVSAAVLPLGVVVLAVIGTFGAMSWLGIPFGFPSQIIPSFLIAVAICDAVHILTIFYQGLDRGMTRKAAMIEALVHSGLAVVLTSLTTAGGMLSFSVAEIAPVARLGVVVPIGVMLTLALTLTLLPALLVLMPARVRRPADSASSPAERPAASRLTAIIVAIGGASARNPKTVLAATVLLVLVCTTGLVQLRFSHSSLDFLLVDDPVRVAVERIDAALGGISTVEVLIDTGKENGLYDPNVLRRIDRASERALALDDGKVHVAKAISILDIVKEIHSALAEESRDAYVVPDDRELIAQELLLFENSSSDDLGQVTDTEFRSARLTLRVPLEDAMYYVPFLASLESVLTDALGPELPFEITGSTVLESRTFAVVITSIARSYLLALAIITPLMMGMIGSWRLGLISMLPNLLPVVIVLAFMGWRDIPLNLSTLLVGSIVIGLAVDDTIHFFHRFDRYFAESGDTLLAIRKTLQTTGSALFTTSVVLTLSFGVFMLGSMQGIQLFGLLAAFGAAIALVADLVLAPALVVMAKRQRPVPVAGREPQALGPATR